MKNKKLNHEYQKQCIQYGEIPLEQWLEKQASTGAFRFGIYPHGDIYQCSEYWFSYTIWHQNQKGIYEQIGDGEGKVPKEVVDNGGKYYLFDYMENNVLELIGKEAVQNQGYLLHKLAMEAMVTTTGDVEYTWGDFERDIKARKISVNELENVKAKLLEMDVEEIVINDFIENIENYINQWYNQNYKKEDPLIKVDAALSQVFDYLGEDVEEYTLAKESNEKEIVLERY